ASNEAILGSCTRDKQKSERSHSGRTDTPCRSFLAVTARGSSISMGHRTAAVHKASHGQQDHLANPSKAVRRHHWHIPWQLSWLKPISNMAILRRYAPSCGCKTNTADRPKLYFLR